MRYEENMNKNTRDGENGIECKEINTCSHKKGGQAKHFVLEDNTLRPDLFGESSGYETRPYVLAVLVVGERYLSRTGEEQKKQEANFSVPILRPFYFFFLLLTRRITPRTWFPL